MKMKQVGCGRKSGKRTYTTVGRIEIVKRYKACCFLTFLTYPCFFYWQPSFLFVLGDCSSHGRPIRARSCC